jgi:hypothetical protein
MAEPRHYHPCDQCVFLHSDDVDDYYFCGCQPGPTLIYQNGVSLRREQLVEQCGGSPLECQCTECQRCVLEALGLELIDKCQADSYMRADND